MGLFQSDTMDTNNIYSKFLECNSISTDTRDIKTGSMFVALRGDNFNGNKFVKEAINKGAAYAIIDDKNFEIPGKTILTDNSLKCLQDLAREHRNNMDAQIIAITGTNGKTTTKELCFAVMSSFYECVATKGNLNNHIGVPLSLLKIKKDTEFAIIEMGANHPNEIKELCDIVIPDYGLITNVGKAHLEGFGSFEGVQKTKAELYDFLRENNGLSFINIDNHTLLNMIGEQEIVSYAFDNGAYCQGKTFREDKFVGIKWKTSTQSDKILTNLRGIYNAENILAAICIGNYFDIPSKIITKAIKEYKPTNKRSELRKTVNNTLFLDLYNANLSSMDLSIRDFYSEKEDQTLILGDMKELGDASESAHLEILNLIQDLGYCEVFLTGDCFFQHKNNFPYYFYKDTKNLADYLRENRIKNKNIFLKGSRSMQLEQVIEFL
jgi:UDP-N-acetylmuramoyl-tripeptide--D-alanyl-D-alanine ligase